ncbi:unnamed protein product [Soboliphyme baturini]|uniref:HTH psq-type domain-containing protein n=1 Tax=Soboliphyme baturini TaxID=241478 RepID=A0A183J4R2_9BILA|nr:unnamed protein product [Soboliphyme baturini]
MYQARSQRKTLMSPAGADWKSLLTLSLKQSLKIDTVASEVASKLNTAKGFVQQQHHNITASRPVKTVKDKIGQLVPQSLSIGNYFRNYNFYLFHANSEVRPAVDATHDPHTFVLLLCSLLKSEIVEGERQFRGISKDRQAEVAS